MDAVRDALRGSSSPLHVCHFQGHVAERTARTAIDQHETHSRLDNNGGNDDVCGEGGESSLVQCCDGFMETKQSWASEDAALPKTGDGASAKGSAPRTLVWWDTESSPAPTTEWNAGDGIAHHWLRMLALPDMSWHEIVTCIAYGAGEVSEPLLMALKQHGIVVHRRKLPTCTLPGEGTTLSMKSMIVDILFWALNNAPPAKVRIISASTELNFSKLVRGLHRRSYDVFLASSFTAPLTHTVMENGEYFQSSNFTTYWQSLLKQIPESDESTFSLEQLQLLHGCLVSEVGSAPVLPLPVEAQRQDCWTSMAHLQVVPPRPTYKDITTGGGLSNGLSSLWNRDSKADAESVGPKTLASLADVRRWLENFVEVGDSLYGMNISLMPKSFDRIGMKLDLKHLDCPSLSRLLLDNFVDIVRLKFPTKDSTVMFPAQLGAQAMGKLITNFTDLLTHLLPKRDSETPLSLLKTAFRTRFHYELDHEAAGFIKLSQFLSSMPKIVRVRQRSSQGKELVICRPSVYYSKQRT